MMTDDNRTVVVVGGGTAGWLTAAVVAAERRALNDFETSVVLIESPDVPTIGVGEGTWPSMRTTLQRIGLPEADVFRQTDASFKQGTRFVGWSDTGGEDTYYHPFSIPASYSTTNLAPLWLSRGGQRTFAEFVTPQSAVIDRGLAPKQAGMPDYAFAVNYAYHLDAGRFATLLREHSIAKLGIRHILANVTRVVGKRDEDIEALVLDSGEQVKGSLFVDCTGHRGLLIGEHYGVDYTAVHDVLFNDRAIAVQVPHIEANTPIASATVSTATSAGWIWDIGLQSRRGIGHVFASSFTSDEQAQAELESYVARDPLLNGEQLDAASYRTLRFNPGYRRQFWRRNCVAVGLSAGFVEPLEASAIALIEQSAMIVARQLPRNREIMQVVASGFNDKMRYHWQRIIEFLKLHYALSQRDDSAYWRTQRDPASWPDGLRDKLLLWQQQAPYHFDAPMIDELFPSASYQYVLYGMGFRPKYPTTCAVTPGAENALHEVQTQQQKFISGLAPNRSTIDALVRG